MTPEQFIRKWTAAKLSERSAAQQHFLDLCALLGEPGPRTIRSSCANYRCCTQSTFSRVQSSAFTHSAWCVDPRTAWPSLLAKVVCGRPGQAFACVKGRARTVAHACGSRLTPGRKRSLWWAAHADCPVAVETERRGCRTAREPHALIAAMRRAYPVSHRAWGLSVPPHTHVRSTVAPQPM